MTSYRQTTAPSGEPVTLAEAKAWLRVDHTEEDVLISALVEAARLYIETFTRRALITQQFALSLDAFPCCNRFTAGERITQSLMGWAPGRQIVLPRPPLASVQSITYYDTDGAQQTFSSGSYHVDTVAQPGRIVLHEDYDWPDTDERPNAVTVAYTAGYGTPADVPQNLRIAIRFMVTHWYTNRTPINIGNIVNQIPATAEALIWQYRLPEFA